MKKICYYFPIFLFIIGISSCRKDEAKGVDEQLYDMAKDATGFIWYKNSGAYLNKSSGSGHSQPFLRTRYNSTAATMLDSDGKVKPGAQFADGSVVVKELANSNKEIELYAILYKKSGHKYADERGWVWGYINSDKTVRASSSDKGSSCKGCHSQDGSIDYMLMNKYFP